ncbi:hypothetical protein BOTBODRAFT_69038 [Botryobasidium botryosum FD-172 SS1]|uniref:Uncharacterized protein n=1 Tax=Botryobasidium botryosum (strain FD-172 SS1) TaxID=930990 RepID=A0A067MDH1_BOTB1|nr:hypothetical protein BOTBODRAFT_69038 [Botryobasidium botryosum FD-172 SS1]
MITTGSLDTTELARSSITVDDADSRIVYSGLWDNQNCPTCPSIPPAAELGYICDGTWHEGFQPATASVPLSASFTFTGTSIYVFGILAPSGPATIRTNLSFTLDGVASGQYLSDSASNVPYYQYRVNFFAAEGLTNQLHTVAMSLSPASLVMLDFFMYANDSLSTTTAGKSTNSKPAIGGAVGGTLGILAVVLGALLLLFFRKRMMAETPSRRWAPPLSRFTNDTPTRTSVIPVVSRAATPSAGPTYYHGTTSPTPTPFDSAMPLEHRNTPSPPNHAPSRSSPSPFMYTPQWMSHDSTTNNEHPPRLSLSLPPPLHP